MPTEPTSIDPPLAASKATDEGVCDHVDDAAESDHCGERDTDAPDDDRVSVLERRVTELEAELEAVRGLFDGVETVDRAVERRADAALAKAEALEERFAPESDRLVRERLPETGSDTRRRPGNERGDRRRDDHHDAGADPADGSRRTDARSRDGSSRDSEGHPEAAGHPRSDDRGSARTVGRGRIHPEDEDTTDEGAVGSGAISSVGSGSEDGDDPDRPLAARLRDAFR